MTRRTRRARGLRAWHLALVLLVVGVWTISQNPNAVLGVIGNDNRMATSPTLPQGENAAASVTLARAELEKLDVKGRAPKTGYDRELFGDGWADLDGDGCPTRDEILRRDLTDLTLEPGSDCVVVSGQLEDPYTGTSIDFTRGRDTSIAVQIDHVVALSDAWQKGAQQWTSAKRLQFANDPANLLAVDGPTNAAKSDGDAATWLPPHKAFRCEYVAAQVHVKAEYALWLTPAEHDATARLLDTCHTLSTTH